MLLVLLLHWAIVEGKEQRPVHVPVQHIMHHHRHRKSPMKHLKNAAIPHQFTAPSAFGSVAAWIVTKTKQKDKNTKSEGPPEVMPAGRGRS